MTDPATARKARRFQVEEPTSIWGYCVRERGKRRIAVFFRRSEARAFARMLNELGDIPRVR